MSVPCWVQLEPKVMLQSYIDWLGDYCSSLLDFVMVAGKPVMASTAIHLLNHIQVRPLVLVL